MERIMNGLLKGKIRTTEDRNIYNIFQCKRNEIYYADLGETIGSEQGGRRPVVIIQNDIGNRYSPTVIIAAITSRINKAKLPTHVEIPVAERRYGLEKDSVILLEQIRTLDKRRLKEYIGTLDEQDVKRLDNALCTSVNINIKIKRFDESLARTKAQGIFELEKMVNMREIKNNPEMERILRNSMNCQYYDLKSYCEEYGRNINEYFQFRNIEIVNVM